MLLLATLSSAAFFVEVTFYEWAENESHYEIVYPATKPFVRDAKKLFPQLKFGDHDDVERLLSIHFQSMQERFEPTDNYYLALPQLSISPEQAQAKLFRINNPCRVVLVNGKPTITAPGDVYEMSNVISRAYLVLGYVPPSTLHNPFEWEMIADIRARSQTVIQSHVTAITEELLLLGEYT